MILYVMVQFRDHAHMGSVLYESRAHAALLLLTVTVQQMISNDCPSVQETKYKDGAGIINWTAIACTVQIGVGYQKSQIILN